MDCIYKDCRVVNAFLKSPIEESCRLVRKQGRRGHLKNQARYLIGVKFEEDKHAVVVIKTDEDYRKMYKKWAVRCDHARKCFAGFQSQTLKTFLGDNFDAIMSLDAVALSSTLDSAQSFNQVPVQAPGVRPMNSRGNHRLNDPYSNSRSIGYSTHNEDLLDDSLADGLDCLGI